MQLAGDVGRVSSQVEQINHDRDAIWCIKRTTWLTSSLADNMQYRRPLTDRGAGLTHRASLRLQLQAAQI